MDLYVIRHAVAEPRREDLDDARRALTRRGKARFKKAVRGLDRLGIRLDRLFHSPWLRAVETAELLAPVVEGTTQVTGMMAKAPSKALLKLLDGERVGVVGHEPWLGELVAWLVIGDPGSLQRIVLDKGAVVHLRGEPGPGAMELVALLPPRILRRIGH